MSDAPVTLDGWTFRQIADFVGGDTTVSKVWNWRKWSQTQNYEDHRRFPDSIGRHPETHAELFDQLEIQRWLTLNEKKTSLDDDVFAEELFRMAAHLRGDFAVRDVEAILLAVVTDDFGDLLPQLAKAAKELRSRFSNLDNDSKRKLLKIIRRSFATRDFDEYSTSETLARYIAALVDVTGDSTVFDPCAGTATLLAACADESDNPDSIRLVGCEVNEVTARLGRALISLSNTSQRSEVRKIDSFRFEESFVGFADVVVADPPMGMQINVSNAYITEIDSDGDIARSQAIANIDRRDPRFIYDTPRGTADSAWVQIALAALRPTGGRAAIVVAPGLTFVDKTRELRDAILRRGHLEAVVELNAGLLGKRTSLIPTILLFDTDQKRAMSRTHVLFLKIVEKSKTNDQNPRLSMTFEKAIGVVRKSRLGKTNRNDSSEVGEFEAKTGSVTWRWVPTAEIVAHDFSLRSSVYLTKEVSDDLAELNREIARLKQRLNTIAEDIKLAAESLADAVGNTKAEAKK
jgi:type I restriction-modification system DNA methylase subunit